MTNALLLPEELLLLIYDDAAGKPMLDSSRRPAAVAGAAIVELVLSGALELADEDALIGRKRVLRATGRAVPEHAVMRKVLDKCDGKKPKDAVSAVAGFSSFSNLAKDLSSSLLHDMADDGLLRVELHGLFGRERFPASDGRHEAEIRRRLEAVLRSEAEPDARTAGLIAILQGTKALKKVLPHWDRGELDRRAKAVSEGDWAAKAVKDAVTEMEMVMVAIATTTIANASS